MQCAGKLKPQTLNVVHLVKPALAMERPNSKAKTGAEIRFIGAVYSDDTGFVRILPVLNHHHVLARDAHGGSFSDSDVNVWFRYFSPLLEKHETKRRYDSKKRF